jgi:hypothetical protein
MRRVEFPGWFGLLAVFAGFTVSCAGPVVKQGAGVRHEVRRIDLTRVRFHRPDRIPVSPGELEESDRRDEIRSCLSPSVLWAEGLARHEAVTKCLNGLKNGTVAYRLVKQASLELVFEPESENDPSCLARELPRIPLPREIYFQAETEPSGTLDVLSLSLDPKHHAWVDWNFLTPRPRIRFPVPPSRQLRGARDLEAWLLTSVFSLFLPEQGPIRAAYVPEFDAKSCFDGQRNPGIPGVFWP